MCLRDKIHNFTKLLLDMGFRKNYSFLLLVFVFIFGLQLKAQDFNQFFENKTLRLDYIFGGNSEEQTILLDKMVSYPQWSGRKHHLTTTVLKGSGQIHIYDVDSDQLIYTKSFSTLFQEWLSTEEATQTKRSFENVFLVPFPKNNVRIEVVLNDGLGNQMKQFIQNFNPKEIQVQEMGRENITPFEYIHKAKKSKTPINVAFVAEGYREGDMEAFLKAAKTATQEILSYYPFKQYADCFNFIAVKSISKDAGVSVPHKNNWKNTAVNAHFDTFYAERYLTTNEVQKVHDVLAGIPYQFIIVLANTKTYGGGGIFNLYTLVSTGSKQFKPVVVHEFGHSFGGLGDEYFYPGDVLSNLISSHSEPWEPNITTLVHFDRKWKDELKEGTPIPTPLSDAAKYPIGVYEGLPGKAIYTSSLDCRMKTNRAPAFCHVCQQAIKRMILYYIE